MISEPILPLRVGVYRQRAEVDVRFVRVAFGPGRVPCPHPPRRPSAQSHHARKETQALGRCRPARAHGRHACHAQQRAG